MSFDYPESFLLLPIVLIIGWFWPRLGLFRPLRLLILVIIAGLLAVPKIEKQQNALDLVVLLDRSESTEDLIDKGLPEWTRLLEKSKPGRKDTLRFVNFAAEVADAGIDGSSFTGSRKLTKMGLALSNQMAQVDETKPTRVLLFTDGYSTEPLNEAAEQLKARGVPLDFRLIRDEVTEDVRLARLSFPERVQVGEPYLISILIRGNTDGVVPLFLKRNGQLLVETEVVLKDGVGKVEFTDRIPKVGSYEYVAEIKPDEDAHLGNNRASRWIEITGGPRLLLVTKYVDDPVAQAMADMDFDVQVVSNLSQLQPGLLGGTKAVIFNNVPAHEIPGDFMRSLDFFVREQGGGFLMAGGKRSFGSGGYFQSEIDELLPVSMELKSEHRKLAVALAIVMDRSGSMGMGVAGGKTKMDLANSGAISAINLLGMMDQATVFAVDSEPTKVVPLTTVGGEQKGIAQRVSRISSGGGGIYVYTGLKAAWEELRKSKAGTRHIILFTDTQDTEEPGDYKKLLKEMTDGGATVSVIGLGTDKDVDADLCKDIAKLGNGRIFFSDRPMDIPKIFAQETVTIARSAFLEDPVKVVASGRWGEISPKPLEWMQQVGGYNLSYARKDATVSLASADEYVAPLVAHARRGLGRTAAVSFPLGGEFSEEVRNWEGYGDFMQTIGRFLMGQEMPPGIAVRHKVDGTRLNLDLLYDAEEWGERLGKTPPTVKLQEEAGGDVFELAWRRIAPGHFSLSRDLKEGSVVKGAIRVAENAIGFGPLSVGTSVEWAFEPERVSELRQVSFETNGRELLNLEEAWLRPPSVTASSLSIPLGIFLLCLILLDALITRTGWKLPVFVKREKRAKVARVKRVKAAKVAKPKPIQNTKVEVAPEKSEQPSERRSRFQRAKDRK
ncbi:VWA domain-containing protein [Luteolibacter sp. AS25]|uniref:VWA domain-containing protein n=1 Tax=Luteolibacter sp. AS25 TaxID=3135776 RepID=UPI00398B4F8C